MVGRQQHHGRVLAAALRSRADVVQRRVAERRLETVRDGERRLESVKDGERRRETVRVGESWLESTRAG